MATETPQNNGALQGFCGIYTIDNGNIYPRQGRGKYWAFIYCTRCKNHFNLHCYIASAETKPDWLIHGHVALDKCNVSLGQQVNNCCHMIVARSDRLRT